MASVVHGGRFDFDDGGTYCGGWEDGKAHGYGVCTGPKGLGEFSGFWQFGYEVSGIYLWPSGNRYEGQWMSGKRHGLGAERKGRWIYKGEWTQGFKGRYGIRFSEKSGARYEGTWANGLQDGYGREVYADGGTYLGQVSQGLRSGFGVRQSVPYGVATRYRIKNISESLSSIRSMIPETDMTIVCKNDKNVTDNRGGFVLKREFSDQSLTNKRQISSLLLGNNSYGTVGKHQSNFIYPKTNKAAGLRKAIMAKLRKQKSTGDIEHSIVDQSKKITFNRSSRSTTSYDSRHSSRTCPASNYREMSSPDIPNSVNNNDRYEPGKSPTFEFDEYTDNYNAVIDPNVVESYMGEWKADKRSGFGIAERSDGLRYEGEWLNNKRNGYGVTTFPDGTREEGKYKDNTLVTNKQRFSKIWVMRSSKLRQRAIFAANNAISAAQSAHQKAEIAVSRASNARAKAHAAEVSAKHSSADSDLARQRAREIAPEFKQPGLSQACRDPIVLDIDSNEANNQFGNILQERISTTLPYPTGLDYTTGVPGIPAATLYNVAHANMNNSAQMMTSVQNAASLYPPTIKPLFMSNVHGFINSGTDKMQPPHPQMSNLNNQLGFQLVDTTDIVVGGGNVNIGFSPVWNTSMYVPQSVESTPLQHEQMNKTDVDLSGNQHIPESSNDYENNGQLNGHQELPVNRDSAHVRHQNFKVAGMRYDENIKYRQKFPISQVSVDSPLFNNYRDTLCDAPSPHLRRRKSLPSIILNQRSQFVRSNNIAVPALFNPFVKKSQENISDASNEEEQMIIDDDGVRKRVKECNSEVNDTQSNESNSPQLRKRIILEKVREERYLSIPEHIDISHIQGLTRREICDLSSKRREELRRERYLKENPLLRLKISLTDYIRKHRLLLGALGLIVLFLTLWISKETFTEHNNF
ncbi:hypothetical protein GJ496_003279 [Pomphorhynchus laevis]|nr:hypothetical protein GJ496_003279 [Pomphorhynchus laevis]